MISKKTIQSTYPRILWVKSLSCPDFNETLIILDINYIIWMQSYLFPNATHLQTDKVIVNLQKPPYQSIQNQY